MEDAVAVPLTPDPWKDVPRYAIARIAGNIASGLVDAHHQDQFIVKRAVELARAIVVEVERTEPAKETP